MADHDSLVPMVKEAAVVVSGTITSLITRTRASGVVQRTQLELLKNQTAKVLADARAYHAGELVTTNLEQLAKTQDYIDSLEKRGQLHGRSLDYAMQQLDELNNMLRHNLRNYESDI